MSSFLAQLAEKIAVNHEIPLEQTVVVVPNKRAKRELLHELAFHFSKPVFAPNILSVNEFIESLSSIKKIDNDELLMRLFDVHTKKNREKSDDFATFLTWAPIFLQDINEIDMHLADAKTIFTNLSEIKTLETSFGKETLTEMQRKYLLFYNQLADLYINFTIALQKDNFGYEGMIYKDAVNNINRISHTTYRYVFAGFNAVTPAELEVVQYFYVHQNAAIYFDVDQFYSAHYGVFIEEIRQKLRISEVPKTSDYKNIPKQIACIGAPKRTAQVVQAVEILNKIEHENGNLNDTVLVLADETMLLPFVHAYNTENANITKGYPLRATAVAQKLQKFIDTEKLNNRLQKPVFFLKTQGFEFLQYLRCLFQKHEDAMNALMVDILDEVSAFLMKFFANAATLDFVIVSYFLQEKLNAATLPFTGNAREGLQIMGLLETRMLDFKNVIVLSMNEGVLPKGKTAPSLLLHDIKRHFGLSTYQQKDTIFGYHFFRLLQRAENVFLIYDNESSNNLAEKSRFVEQLEFEVKKQGLLNNIQITHNQFFPFFSLPDAKTTINIAKTIPIMEKVKKLSFSPTSLQTYINCPLQFYWRFVEKIDPPKVFDENNASAIIGTIIHAVLEEIFVQLKQKTAQFSYILSDFEKNIDEILQRVFKDQPEIGNAEIYQGKLFLAYEIAKKSILDYIKVVQEEWSESVYQIIGTEIPLVAEVCIENKTFVVKGKADRVEMRDNKVTVLDYKTGKVEAKDLKCNVEEFEAIFADAKFAQLFQLLCYAYLYQNDKQNVLIPTREIQCGIIAFQELYKKSTEYICYAQISKEKILTPEHLQLFESHLKQLFIAIFDESAPFCQTENAENCTYCEYGNICNK